MFSRTEKNKNTTSKNEIIPFGPWIIWKKEDWEDIDYGLEKWNIQQKRTAGSGNQSSSSSKVLLNLPSISDLTSDSNPIPPSHKLRERRDKRSDKSRDKSRSRSRNPRSSPSRHNHNRNKTSSSSNHNNQQSSDAAKSDASAV